MKSRSFGVLSFISLLFIFSVTYAQNWEWSSHLTSSNKVQVNAVAYDKTNDALLTISVFQAAMNIGTKVFTPVGGSLKDILIVKYNNIGDTLWTRQIGSNNNEVPKDIIVDESGNIYITGSFSNGADFGGTVLNAYHQEDAFLAKYNPNGTLAWAKNIGQGQNRQRGNNLAIDNSGNIYMIGFFQDSIDFGSNWVLYDTAAAKLTDNFIAKFNNSGILLDTVQIFGSVDATRLNAISIANDGGILISGFFQGQLTIKTQTLTSQGNDDIVFVKLDATFNLDWIRQIGSSGSDRGYHAESDKMGNTYLVGVITGTANVDSTDTGIFDAQPITSNGGYDIFLAKYNTAGTLQWKMNLGDTGEDLGLGLNIYENLLHFSGYFCGEIVFKNDTIKSSSTTNMDVFFGVVNMDSNPITAKSIQGDNEDRSQAIAYDGQGNEYIAGYFKSTSLTIGTDVLINLNPPNKDGFVAKYDLPFSVTYTEQTNVTCNGGSDGELIVTPFFGAPPYNYVWTPSVSTDSTASNLSAGTYKVKVTDNNSDVDSVTTDITQPSSITVDRVITDVKCFNGNDGEIDINPSGSNPPYTYFWSTTDGSGVTATDEDQTGLTPGTYDVTVTDKNGCTTDSSFVVGEPTQIQTTMSGTDVSGAGAGDGEARVDITGGTPNYIYFWYDDDSTYTAWDSTLVYTKDTISGLDGDVYHVVVTDVNGCKATDQVTINEPGVLIATATKTKVSCYNGSDGTITVTPSGGTPFDPPARPYTYEWSHDAGLIDSIATGLSVGDYWVKVEDKNSVKDTAWVTLIQPPELIASIDSVKDVSCNGGSDGFMDMNVTGGTLPYSYSWTGPNGFTSNSEDISNLSPGTYSVVVTDANGCPDADNDAVNEPLEIMIGSNVTNVSCNGFTDGAIDLTISGGTQPYTYLWSNSLTTEDIAFLPAGTYSVTVTDANGCEKFSGNITVSEPLVISIQTVNTTDPLCFGGSDGSIDITGAGGTGTLTYCLMPDSTCNITGAFSNLSAYDYDIRIIDDNSCTKTFDIALNDPPKISITASIQDVSCNGGSDGAVIQTTSGGTPPYTYEWYKGTTYITDTKNLTGQFAGDYTLKVFDANSCEKDSTFTISEPAVLAATVNSTNVTCNGGNDGTITITSPTGGSGSYEYTVDGGTTWQASGNFGSLTAATYNVQIRDANATGCVITLDGTLVISEPAALSIDSEATTDITCKGLTDGTVTITASGGAGNLQYSIDGGITYIDNEGNFTGQSAGDYDVMVKDANDCEKAGSTITIIEPDQITIDLEESTDIICYGDADGTITITASGGTGVLTYTLNPGAIQTNSTGAFTGLSSGTFTVDVDDANGCGPVTSGSIVVVEPDSLYIDSISVTNTFTGQSIGEIKVYALGGTGSLEFSIDNGDTYQSDSTFTGLSAGIYVIVVKDANGCTKTIQKEVEELSPIPEIYDAFTPNGDGVNDYWNIYYLDLLYPNCIVKVYSTWGTLVFSSNGYPEPWDGTRNGTKLPAGTYIYVIDLGDGSDPMTGTVNIIK